MARPRKVTVAPEKRKVIAELIEAYNVQTTADLQEALKDLLGGTIQSMLEAEIDEQMEEMASISVWLCP